MHLPATGDVAVRFVVALEPEALKPVDRLLHGQVGEGIAGRELGARHEWRGEGLEGPTARQDHRGYGYASSSAYPGHSAIPIEELLTLGD